MTMDEANEPKYGPMVDPYKKLSFFPCPQEGKDVAFAQIFIRRRYKQFFLIAE